MRVSRTITLRLKAVAAFATVLLLAPIAASPGETAAGTWSLERIRTALDQGLPLAGSWNTGKFESGFHPTWQLTTAIQTDGHVLLPWFQGPGPDAKWDERDVAYYEAPMQACAERKLPISFRYTQWENDLLKQADKPEAENPCLVRPDGTVEPVIGPFGPKELWYAVGRAWTDSAVLKKLQDVYPDPPLVLIFSNNEPKIAKRVHPGNCKRLAARMQENGIDPKDIAAIGKLVEEAWQVRYRRMLDGLRDALVSEAWKKNAVIIPYSGFNNRGTLSEDRITWHKPHAWDGISVHLYTSDWEVVRDFWVASPQGIVANIDWAFDRVRKTKPDFFEELSIWYENDPLVKILEYKHDQTYTLERYRGVVQFVLWGMRPQVLREYRGYRETRAKGGRAFYVVANAVGRVHAHPLLRRFWKDGRIVPNNARKPFPPFAGPDRWYVLPADANETTAWNNRKARVHVYALALVLGEAGKREWLLYAHAPLANWACVRITIPGFQDVIVGAPQGGAFYHVTEKDGQARPLGLLHLPHNVAPVAAEDRYAVAADERLETSNQRFLGVAGVLGNDTDANGDPVTAALVDKPAHGTLDFHADGTFVYTPQPGFHGTDRFTYRASDGALPSDPAAVTIGVRQLARVVDDTDPWYAEEAHWRTLDKRKNAYGGDFDFYPAGGGTDTRTRATWTFTGLEAGQYRLYATWPKWSYQMPERVPFEIFDGPKSVGTAHGNQSQAAAGDTAAGHAWTKLGIHTIQSGTCRVVMTNAARGRWVMADAVRLVPAGGGEPRIVDNGDEGYEATAGWLAGGKGYKGTTRYVRGQKGGDKENLAQATWTLADLEPGVYEVFLTWTASNTRTWRAPFTLYDGETSKGLVRVNQTKIPDSLFAGGAWWESLGEYVLEAGTLKVVLSNRTDKKKVIADAVAVARVDRAAGRILDDGDEGFEALKRGERMGHGCDGDAMRFNNEAREPAPVAAWTFGQLAPATYAVFATWQRNNFSVAGVPYRARAGETTVPLGTVDQSKDATGRRLNGVAWQRLGTVEVAGDTLIVEVLTVGKQKGKVVADAVWIQPVDAGAAAP